MPGAYEKRVKVMPQTEEFELYNLSDDPMELDNLAGRLQYATTEAALKLALKGEAKPSVLRRLRPRPGHCRQSPICRPSLSC